LAQYVSDFCQKRKDRGISGKIKLIARILKKWLLGSQNFWAHTVLMIL